MFPAAMAECPVCLEPYGLDEHIPKSLDCRHAVCAECVMNPRGQPLQLCPICRRGINNHSAIPNDLSILDFLEKKKRKKYLKARKKKLQDLIEQAWEASAEVGGHLKEETVIGAKIAKERSTIFTLYIQHLFKKCLELCISQRVLSDFSTKHHMELEDLLQELQMCISVCTSLLDNPHASTDEIDRCETDTLNAVKKSRDSGRSGTSEEAMWNSYRQLVIETLVEISKVPPSRDHSFHPGEHL